MKHLIVGGVVGLLFMTGGFWYGMRIAPKPAPPATVAKSTASAKGADAAASGPANASPITIDTLEKTSETMMSLNDALKTREQAVALREEKAKEREDELDAERAALNASHEKFKTLFNEFQERLQLVEANQSAQLQKQADLYSSMGVDQSVDLVRVMDDAAITRLFSVMDTKPLGKLIVAWKSKFPQDTQRVLHVLDGMAQVMPKDKIALTDSPASASPDAGSPASAGDNPAPLTPPAADGSSTPASAPAGNASPAPADPAPDSATPATPTPDAAAPNQPPAANSDGSPAPDGTPVPNTPSASPDSTPPLTPPADPPQTKTPTSTAAN